ncbi:MAG: class I SAM-dependent methyltransferase [Candidatus Thermoplasmatota archaeon]
MIEQEAAFWAGQAEDAAMKGFSPDLEKPFAATTVQAIWDDSELDFMIRGKYIDRILDYCSGRPQLDCLELCCGTGMLALGVSRRGARVIGIDVSPRVIEIAETYARDSGIPPERLEYHVCDLNRVSLPEERFDVVFAWDGLHHIAEIEHLVSEVRKTLRDGGVFVVHDHAKGDSRIGDIVLQGLAAILGLIVPTDSSFLAKLKMVFKRASPMTAPTSVDNHRLLDSPFEDVSGEGIVESITENFRILEFERYLSLPGTLYARVWRNPKTRTRTIGALMAFDRLLCGLHILHPEYFFIMAKKETVHSDD